DCSMDRRQGSKEGTLKSMSRDVRGWSFHTFSWRPLETGAAGITPPPATQCRAGQADVLQHVIVQLEKVALLLSRPRSLPPTSQQIHSRGEPGAGAGMPCVAKVSGSRCIARETKYGLCCHRRGFHCGAYGTAGMECSPAHIPRRNLLNFCSEPTAKW